MPRPARDPRSIRPGLLVFALCFLTAVVAGVGSVVTSTGPFASSAPIAPDRGGRRITLEAAVDDHDEGSARLDDPGAQGSAREAWASVSTGEQGRLEPLPPLVEAIVDPQMRRFHVEYSEESPPPFTPVARRARVLAASGIELGGADACELRVLPVPDGSFNCLVRVMCGRTVLYPNRAQTAGYVSCELGETSPNQAADSLPTVTDGDPAVSFDLARGTVTVHDSDAEGRTLFHVSLQLDPAPMRVM